MGMRPGAIIGEEELVAGGTAGSRARGREESECESHPKRSFMGYLSAKSRFDSTRSAVFFAGS
jgi:hypothetical protein